MQRLLKRWIWTIGGAIVVISVLIICVRTYLVYEQDPHLEIKEPYAYFQGKKFTGWLYGMHSTFRISKWVPFHEGLRHGKEIHWYSNGQRWIERHFKRGKLHGINQGWFEDGRVRFRREYQEGQDYGEYWAWHSNGQLAYYVKYKYGNEVSYKSWSAFGKPFYNYVWQDGLKVGLKGGSFCKPIRTRQ